MEERTPQRNVLTEMTAKTTLQEQIQTNKLDSDFMNDKVYQKFVCTLPGRHRQYRFSSSIGPKSCVYNMLQALKASK